MVGVGDQKRLLVEKHGLRLFEGNAVLAPVLRILSVVPLETNNDHRGPLYLQCNENSTMRLGALDCSGACHAGNLRWLASQLVSLPPCLRPTPEGENPGTLTLCELFPRPP